MRLTPDQRTTIEECVSKRGDAPPGEMQWGVLRKTLVQVLFADAEEKDEDTHYEADLID